MPLAVFGGTRPRAPGTTGARADAAEPRLRRAVQVGVEDGDARPAARRAPRRVCMVSVLLPTPPLPEPIATMCRTSARLSAILERLATTWPMTSEPPSPAMSW